MKEAPPGSVLLVRHAQATGQAPDAPLTPQGEQQARALAGQLAPLGVTRIVSSPWRRAVDTTLPLAVTLGLAVQTDERLTERVLSRRSLPFWRSALRVSFDKPRWRLPGGESGLQARRRAQAALQGALDPAGVSVVVTHGNLLALLLELDYNGWAALRNPDVWLWGGGPGQAQRLVLPPPTPHPPAAQAPDLESPDPAHPDWPQPETP